MAAEDRIDAVEWLRKEIEDGPDPAKVDDRDAGQW